nr:O-antigen ligase family protein [uncultured Flavobacterium sp.]
MIKFLLHSKLITIICIHLLIGVIAVAVPKMTLLITVFVFLFGVIDIVKNKDRNNEALFYCCYVVGVEVFLRMTGGMIFNEYAKYTVMVFCFLGLLYQNFKADKFIYIALLLLLLPAVIIGLQEASYEVNLRKAMMFNISGQLTLLVAAIYTLNKNIRYQDLIKIPYLLALPILSIVSFIIVKSPSLKVAMTSTQSNFATSGGFGPNQVSTILGLGTFCLFAIFLLYAKTRTEKIIVLILMVVCAFRGLLTMSRGGMICGAIMILLLMGYVFLFGNSKLKTNIIIMSVLGILGFVVFWSYTVFASGGMLEKRYNNQDARGRVKESVLTGRETLIESEFQMFFDNPIFGIGVGRNKEVREEMIGIEAASHNEISRLFAEHGSFGVFILLTQILVPLVLWLDNKRHILLIPFFIYWALTINHAAMRTASPSFIYALTLLRVRFDPIPNTNENTIYRQSISA